MAQKTRSTRHGSQTRQIGLERASVAVANARESWDTEVPDAWLGCGEGYDRDFPGLRWTGVCEDLHTQTDLAGFRE